MASVPTASDDVTQSAVPDDNGTLVQPLIAVPFEVKLTVPVAPSGLTVAVIVTWSPNVDGFGELVTVVMLNGNCTTCITVFEALGAYPFAPWYTARML